ncbi:MAG: site-specific DNA-methyltransferase [Candidatus Lokiarchaeota archaeon]|nr:site-specific DNA-methyltransferase [Candidatus Lokiarchaeota archaeon]
MNEKKRNYSKTSHFGVSKRESHDSSSFYNSKLYKNLTKPKKIKYFENTQAIPKDILNTIIHGDSQKMKDLPDESVHLMITSPPYNVSKSYDKDLSLNEYLMLLENVFKETWRVLVPGGRAAINIANVGRKPYIPLHSYIIEMMLNLGFHMRGEIIWDKGASAGISCAWGSFSSASNPCLRDVHEYILIFSKLTNRLEKGLKKNSISNEDFVEWSKSIWAFQAESAKKIGHPAPFPIELPKRLIEFYSFVGDVVLDPFMGSGTTAVAALQTKRYFIGYEISDNYLAIAQKRILDVKSQLKLENFV